MQDIGFKEEGIELGFRAASFGARGKGHTEMAINVFLLKRSNYSFLFLSSGSSCIESRKALRTLGI